MNRNWFFKKRPKWLINQQIKKCRDKFHFIQNPPPLEIFFLIQPRKILSVVPSTAEKNGEALRNGVRDINWVLCAVTAIKNIFSNEIIIKNKFFRRNVDKQWKPLLTVLSFFYRSNHFFSLFFPRLHTLFYCDKAWNSSKQVWSIQNNNN